MVPSNPNEITYLLLSLPILMVLICCTFIMLSTDKKDYKFKKMLPVYLASFLAIGSFIVIMKFYILG